MRIKELSSTTKIRLRALASAESRRRVPSEGKHEDDDCEWLSDDDIEDVGRWRRFDDEDDGLCNEEEFDLDLGDFSNKAEEDEDGDGVAGVLDTEWRSDDVGDNDDVVDEGVTSAEIASEGEGWSEERVETKSNAVNVHVDKEIGISRDEPEGGGTDT
jgi:hypothetical protein